MFNYPPASGLFCSTTRCSIAMSINSDEHKLDKENFNWFEVHSLTLSWASILGAVEKVGNKALQIAVDFV